jgi:heat shock protein HslJ
MKKLGILFIIIVAVVACKQPQKKGVEKTFWVNSTKITCEGVGKMSCLQIKRGEDFETLRWESFYSNIEGFEYQPGYIYKIKVSENKRENVPADTSSLIYELIEIVSKEQDKFLSITGIWLLQQINGKDVELDPNDAVLEINSSQQKFSGKAICNQINGSIKHVEANKITISKVISTMMMCPNIDLENEYISALQSVEEFEIEANKLLLLDLKGKTILSYKVLD